MYTEPHNGEMTLMGIHNKNWFQQSIRRNRNESSILLHKFQEEIRPADTQLCKFASLPLRHHVPVTFQSINSDIADTTKQETWIILSIMSLYHF